MWMQNRHQSLAEFFDAAREIGFEKFELNHFVSQALVEEADLPQNAIHAVHAPCPVRPAERRAQVSSLDKDERIQAVEDTRASIELAQQVGAGSIVLHPGRVLVNPELERRLRGLYNQGQKHSRAYHDLKQEMVEERARLAEAHLDATRWSLERLAAFADAAGVRIGLENRFHYGEIPLPDELDLLLNDFFGPVGYWMDTGHAYVQEELGFVNHLEWVNGFGTQLVGIHLHDVRSVAQPEMGEEEPQDGNDENNSELKDHVIPGSGIINFEELLPLAKNGVLLTCEFDWYFPPEEIQTGVTKLHEIGFQ
jgi:sugar phosphate isomerase/epimerase